MTKTGVQFNINNKTSNVAIWSIFIFYLFVGWFIYRIELRRI